MVKTLQLMKSLCVAAVLLLGSVSAWAETVGQTDFTTGYLAAHSTVQTITSGGSMHYVFSQTKATDANYKGWLLWVGSKGAEVNWGNAISIVRGDNWDDKWPNGSEFGSNAGCTSNFDWDNNKFNIDMNGATVDMTITYSNGSLAMSSEITASDEQTKYTYSYAKSISNAPASVDVCLSVNAACIVITTAEYTAPATAIATATETYDFTLADHQGNFTYESNHFDYSTGTWGYNATNPWLNNRFSFADGTSSGAHRNYWRVRTFKTNNQYCTGLNYTESTNRQFGIRNLKDGDILIFNNTSAATKNLLAGTTNLKEEGSDEVLAANTELTYGTRYVVSTTDETTMVEVFGQLYCCVTSIQIITSELETIEKPALTVAPSGTDRKVTIENGTSNSFGSPVVTYYTLDGTEPTTESSVYTTPIIVTEACTVKAISVAIGGTISDIASIEVAPGEAVTLAAPAINATNITKVGDYYQATFIATSDNSTVFGAPTATITAVLNGVDVSEQLVAGTFKPMSDGTLTVTASAEGYESATSSIDVAMYYSAAWTSYDFSAITAEVATEMMGNDGTYNKVLNERWASWSKSYNYTQYTSTASLATIYVNDNLRFRNVIELNIGYGLGRNKGESINVMNSKNNDIVAFKTYTGYGNPVDGTNTPMIYAISNGKDYPSISTTNGRLLVQVIYYRKAEVKETTTLDNNGYATFASQYPLDLTSIDGAKAYSAVVEKTNIDFNTLSQTVPAYTGMLLKGKANATVTIPVVAEGTTVENNALLVNTSGEKFNAEGEYTYFAMKKNVLDNEMVVFAMFDPTTVAIPANKAYLRVAKTSGSRLTITFNGGATGINTVEAVKAETEGIYNLNGQRIAAPAKGLYIVNGKKVVLK